MTSRRGTVLVESALTLTVILAVLYGGLQLALVGLDQISADGGAFTMAHQQTFQGGKTQYLDSWTLAKKAFSNLTNAAITPLIVQAEPPTTLFAGQYGFNTPNARYGGVSLVQPVQVTATVTHTNISNLTFGTSNTPLSVAGTAIEPMFRLINGHADVAGNDFNSAPAFSTQADPLSESVPPYMVGFNYMQSCPYQIAGNANPWGFTCPSGSVVSALGSAEYLDAHNWDRSSNGVVPSGVTGSKTAGAVFWETRYHQTLFAKISASLAATTKQGTATAILAAKKAILDPTSPNEVGCVYAFDNNNIGAYAPGNAGIGDPLFALHPDYTSAACAAP